MSNPSPPARSDTMATVVASSTELPSPDTITAVASPSPITPSSPLSLTKTITAVEAEADGSMSPTTLQKSSTEVDHTAVASLQQSAFSRAAASLLEGGLKGWLAVLGSMLIHCFVFAPTEFVFGIFEHHYQEVFKDSTASSIAFVGTTGSAITYIAGFLSGIVADRFGFRPTAFAGTVIMTVSLVLASFSTQLWHLYVTQGVLFGVGASFTYYPAIAVPSQYFVKNRGLAIGIAVSGTGLGGFILAPLTQVMIDRIDIFWSLRILALLLFVVCGGASVLIKERKEDTSLEAENMQEGQETTTDQERTIIPRSEKDLEEGELKNLGDADESSKNKDKKPSFFQSLHVFKDPQFLSLTLAELAASIGYLIPLYYMQTYAIYIGLTADEGALILGISNGSAFVGRILLGIVADRFSNTKTLLFCCWATAFSVMFFWMIAKSFGTLLLMGVTVNLFIGAYVSLVPVAVAESFGTQTIASMIGLMYAAGGLAMWGGSPLAGFILDSTLPNLSYTPVIMTAGGSMILGAVCVTSWAYFNWRANRSVLAGRV
ncbi:hypothetical protein BGX28_003016 [Mortierella sp. GBA30]|nr:hypothetical protein BGX28_003016 [Mortierella sp. GBA30]